MDTIYWWLIIIVMAIGSYFFITQLKPIKMGAGRDDDEDKKEAERIKKLFSDGKYKEGGKYIFMGGPIVRIKYINYWPHTYMVIIEWLDKVHAYNKTEICDDIEKILIPVEDNTTGFVINE